MTRVSPAVPKIPAQIPMARPHITEEEAQIVAEVVRSGTLSMGKYLVEFEKKFADYVGARHAVAVSSGTAGLHLCVRALGLKDGDEVITSPMTFIASTNCLLYERAKPVFVDIDEETLNLAPGLIEAAITPRTKAILPVHMYGLSADMGKITEIAKRRGLKIIEDACEAVGATYEGRKVGSFGNPTVFAFYPNKQMTTGEGGLITTDDADVARLCRMLSNQGRSDSGLWLVHDEIGYNYRMDEMSAAVGVVQLKKLDWMLEQKREVARQYTKRLSSNPDATPFKEVMGKPKLLRSWYIYSVRLESGIDRDDIIRRLGEKGIASKPYFPSLHLQPIYRKLFGYHEGMFPICEKVAQSLLALPFFIGITPEEIERVCAALEESLRETKRRRAA